MWKRIKRFYCGIGAKDTVISTKIGSNFLDPYIHVNVATGELMIYDLGYRPRLVQLLKVKGWEI